jgi:hypothetical protein
MYIWKEEMMDEKGKMDDRALFFLFATWFSAVRGPFLDQKFSFPLLFKAKNEPGRKNGKTCTFLRNFGAKV